MFKTWMIYNRRFLRAFCLRGLSDQGVPLYELKGA